VRNLTPQQFVRELWNNGVIDEHTVASVLDVDIPEAYDDARLLMDEHAVVLVFL